MPAVPALTPRSETAPAPSVAQPGRAQPIAAPETAARPPLERPRDDALGATLARAVQLRPAQSRMPVLQRMYFPEDDEELERGSGVSGLIGVWNWITSFFSGPVAPPGIDASDDETSEDLDDVLDVLDVLDEPIEKVSAEQALVVVGAPSHQHSEHDLAAVVRAIAIRQDFEVNRRLLQSLEQRARFQYVHTYSPDIEQGVTRMLEAVRRREFAEREAKALERAETERQREIALAEIERLAAIEREAKRVLEGCQRIHAGLRSEFKASMSTKLMQELASRLVRFVIDADLGDELAQIASSISTGVNRLTFKDFKVGEPMARKITEAPSLLDALTHLSEAVAGRLAAQEQAKQPHTHKPTRFELETKARYERKAATRTSVEVEEIVPEVSDDTPTVQVRVPVYVPKIFEPPWTETEMRTWIGTVTKRAIDDKNINACVAYVKVHTHTSGGGTKLKHDGRTVFHISHGQRGSDTGCTLFFTKDGDRVQIVAIGQHSGDEYPLDWKVPTFSGNVDAYRIKLKKKK